MTDKHRLNEFAWCMCGVNQAQICVFWIFIMHSEESKTAQHGDHLVLRDYIYFNCEDMKELSELKATASELAVNSVSHLFTAFWENNDTLRIEK